MTRTLTIEAKMRLLSSFVNHLSQGDILGLFEFDSKTPWKKRLCYAFTKTIIYLKAFSRLLVQVPALQVPHFLRLEELLQDFGLCWNFEREQTDGVFPLIPLVLLPMIVLCTKKSSVANESNRALPIASANRTAL